MFLRKVLLLPIAFVLIIGCSNSDVEMTPEAVEMRAELALQDQLEKEDLESTQSEDVKPVAAVTPDGEISISISPEFAYYDSKIIARANGFNIDSAILKWRVRGVRAVSIGSASTTVAELEARKGDSIMLVVNIGDKTLRSNQIFVENSPPKLDSFKLMPERFAPGDLVYVDATASDPNGDVVNITYNWTVNGMPAGSGKRIDSALKRGDSFTVSVIPFDGEVYGDETRITRDIGNMPPQIQQHYSYNFDGTNYTYNVQATDPDGDAIEFSLSSAPSGMTIDSMGMVSWVVPADFVGTVQYMINAKDSNGGTAQMQMSFTLTAAAQ